MVEVPLVGVHVFGLFASATSPEGDFRWHHADGSFEATSGRAAVVSGGMAHLSVAASCSSSWLLSESTVGGQRVTLEVWRIQPRTKAVGTPAARPSFGLIAATNLPPHAASISHFANTKTANLRRNLLRQAMQWPSTSPVILALLTEQIRDLARNMKTGPEGPVQYDE